MFIYKIQFISLPTEINGSAFTFGPDGSENDGKFYRTLRLLDDKLLIGGNMSLFSARTKDLQTLDFVSIPNQADNMWSCDDKYCNNFIRVIQPLSDGVLLECGTNSFRPYCQQRSSQNLSITIGSPQTRSYVAPSVPHQNSSWLLLNDSVSGYQIFAGTNLENSLSGKMSQLGIVKANLEVNQTNTKIDNVLTTKKHLDYVLNSPQFVGNPIVYNDNIYFFYREFAAEHINGGKIVYSRVARICSSEKGGDRYMSFENNFVTFMKARLECSIKGDHPYHYNEIQDIYQSEKDENVVFAVFATGPSGVASSALCAYHLDEMEFMFENSPFKAQFNGDVQNLWLTVRRPESDIWKRRTCPAQTSFLNNLYLEVLLFAHLLDKPVKNKLHCKNKGTQDSNPLLIVSGERFSQIVVDEDVNSVDVFFIGTENGTVLEAYLDERQCEARIIEEISLNTNGVKKPVLTMLKSDSDQAVFVGTDVGVYKVPFQHCQDYTSANACQYPYCSWIDGACITYSANRAPDSIGEEGSQKKETIAILRRPEDQTRFPNRPIHLNLAARALKGRNLNVDGETIFCHPCSHLSFTQRKSVSSRYEFLLLHITGTSAETENCTCFWFLTTDDGMTATGTFNLTDDNSAKPSLASADLGALVKYDEEVLIHKFKKKRWESKMINGCLLENLHQRHGGNTYSHKLKPPFHFSDVLN